VRYMGVHTIETLKQFGLLTKMPKRKGTEEDVSELELDALGAYTWGSALHIVLGEVKRPKKNPWDSTKRLDAALKNSALDQLKIRLECVQVHRLLPANFLCPGSTR